MSLVELLLTTLDRCNAKSQGLHTQTKSCTHMNRQFGVTLLSMFVVKNGKQLCTTRKALQFLSREL